MATPGRRQHNRRTHRQGLERRPGRLARSLGAVPGQCRLCLARRAARDTIAESLDGMRLSNPALADHLGKGPAGHWGVGIITGSMSPAGMRCEARRHWAGGRNADHAVADPEPGAGSPRPCTARRSRSSACAGRSRTTAAPGQAVYEPFAGSGTTIIAAEMCGRACHAIELNPAYVDVAVRRWQAFTGNRREPRRQRRQLCRDRG